MSLATAPSVSAGLHTFLAFDFGVKRTGVASGNSLTRTASPQASISATGDARLKLIAQRIEEWQPDALVVGIPFHPDGASHENTARASLRASCAAAIVFRCLKLTNATVRLRRWPAALLTPTRRRPASSSSNF
jgi:LmbE family N-acetylglucosaminyl deacetylase